MKIKKKTKMIIASLAVISVIVICIFTNNFLKISLQNHLSFFQTRQLYIKATDKNKIAESIEKKKSAAQIFLEKQFGASAQVNEVYQLKEMIYVDMIDKDNGAPRHIIWKYDKEDTIKYIDGTTYLLRNFKNKKIQKIEFDFNHLDITSLVASEYKDPFLNTDFGFVEKNKELGLQESVRVAAPERTLQVSVYETMDQQHFTALFGVSYPKDTDIVTVAVANRTTVSNIVSWFSADAFDQNGLLREDTVLCTKKQFGFRYGRQVGILDMQTQIEIIPVEEWHQARGKLTLQQPFLVNSLYDCIAFEVTQRPNAMDLCDAHFKEKALEAYCK